MPSAAEPVPVVASIAPLAADHEAWLVDVWGVMHNGAAPFHRATDACERFRAQGGSVVLVSNAPRPWQSAAAQLDRIGVPRSAWDALITSGDVARSLIGAFAGRPVLHLGPQRDLPIFEGLGVDLVDAASADAVICTGLYDDESETPEDYLGVLSQCASRDVPMVCANPDLTVERAARIVYCAGALAALYEKLGGSVTYAGKPYPPIYDMAFATLERLRGREVPKARILAIGDGVRTDVAGAARAGIASIYVASGVHLEDAKALDGARLAELFPDPAQVPIAAMTELAW